VVELFSFAKSFHLGGFRLGFALGNADALAALEAVKGPVDFNQNLAIQRMGVACLALPRERVAADAQIWRARSEAMVAALRAGGWRLLEAPKAAMYLFLPLASGPAAGAAGVDELAYCQRLVAETGVALSPGRGFGPGGVGFVRVALVRPAAELVRAAGEMTRVLQEMAGG
jgi:aspartate/methionine/tyrosine aminotransferase